MPHRMVSHNHHSPEQININAESACVRRRRTHTRIVDFSHLLANSATQIRRIAISQHCWRQQSALIRRAMSRQNLLVLRCFTRVNCPAYGGFRLG
jgi:hypothetical protein